jgi:formylglycine-generating enzyme required for sulfatase activity
MSPGPAPRTQPWRLPAILGGLVVISFFLACGCGKHSPPTKPAARLTLSDLTPAEGPPGTIVTAVVTVEGDTTGLRVECAGVPAPSVGGDSRRVRFMMPLLPAGAVPVVLARPDGARSNTQEFTVTALPSTGLPPGQVSEHAIEALVATAESYRILVTVLADSGSVDSDSAAAFVQGLDRSLGMMESIGPVLASLPDSDRVVLDQLLVSTGLGDALGLTTGESGRGGRIPELRRRFGSPGAYSPASILVLLDNCGFVLATAEPILTGISILAWSANRGAVPMLGMSYLAYGLQQVLDGSIPCDLHHLTMEVLADDPRGLAVGRSAEVRVLGRFVEQSSPAPSTVSGFVAGALGRVLPTDALSPTAATIAAALGVSASEPFFPGPRLTAPHAVPLDMEYFANGNTALTDLMEGSLALIYPGLRMARILGLTNGLACPFPDLGSPSVRFQSDLVSYDPQIQELTALTAGIVSSAEIVIRAWRMDTCCPGAWWTTACAGAQAPQWLSTDAYATPSITILPGETNRPDPVTDLAAASATDSSLALTWTAVGIEGAPGTATQYDIRYSVDPQAAWEQMLPVSGAPAPKPAGQPERFIVTHLQPATAYVFAMKVANGASNWSDLSNVAHGTTLPHAPVCQVTPDTLRFGAVTLGQSVELTFVIRNVSADTLTGGVSGDCPAYSLVSGAGSYSLSPGAERPVTVRFSPLGTGTQTCLVNSGTTDCTLLPCTGQGTTEPPLPPEMVMVAAGTFTMGSPADEAGRNTDELPHEVTLSEDLYVSRFEVTQAEWQRIMGWSEANFAGLNRPVEEITWFDALTYCNRLSLQEGRTPVYSITVTGTVGHHTTDASVTADWEADGYRLLTEAEWEYACRAGSSTAFSNGGITSLGCSPLDPGLNQVGWYCGNAAGATHDTGGKAANAWGLADMHGNVWEWCWDRYGDYPAESVTDPRGPSSGSSRLIRGGGWLNYAQFCRSAYRGDYSPESHEAFIGVRIARAAH